MMSDVIYLSDVRLSFPALKEPRSSGQGAIPKYSADFLLPQDHTAVSEFMRVFGLMAQEKWGQHAQQVMQMIGNDRKLRCYGSGDDKVNSKTFQPYDGYAGMMYLTASRKDMPQMIKADGNAVDPTNTMESQAIARSLYGGCYVNAAVRPWLQDNTHGKGVRLDLIAVQFNRDGDAFGEGKSDASSMFGSAQAAPAPAPAPAAAPGIPGIPGIPGMPNLPF